MSPFSIWFRTLAVSLALVMTVPHRVLPHSVTHGPVRPIPEVAAEHLLPDDTFLFARIANVKEFRAGWEQSQRGRLFADPAMKGFVEDLMRAFDEASGDAKTLLGLSIRELLELPQGEFAIAAREPAEKSGEPRIVALIDVGPNVDKTRELLDRITGKVIDAQYTRKAEDVQGVSITVLTPPEDETMVIPPLVWGFRDTTLLVGTDLESIVGVLGRWDGGADKTLARKPSFQRVLERTGEGAVFHAYFDFASLFALAAESVPQLSAAGAGSFAQAMKQLGFDSIHAIGGSYSFGQGDHDSVMKILLHYDTPPRGLVKAMHMKSGELAPELWVPPDVVSYNSFNFGLGDLYAVLDEMVSAIQPGGISGVAQTVLATQGVDLDIKREIIGPLGARFTALSDYATPGNADSARSLVGISVRDVKTAQTTVAKLASLAGDAVKSREFRGHKIYDVTLPDEFAAATEIEGPAEFAIAIAEGHLFIASPAAILEKVLLHAAEKRDGLATADEFRAVARHLPIQAAGIGFTRTDEEFRVTYAGIKSGAIVTLLREMLPAESGETFGNFIDALDGSKLPDFDVLQKYLGPQGLYLVTDDDGLLIVNFELKKE